MPNEHNHTNREGAGCLEIKGGFSIFSSPPLAAATGPAQDLSGDYFVDTEA